MNGLYCSQGRLCQYISYLIFAYLLLCAWRPARGQTPAVIQGRVLSAENQQPLVGASVLLKGTTSGTTTDRDGFFTIASSENMRSLIVSFIGYRSIDTLLVLPLKRELIISLQQDLTMLEEVKVSTGYWETSARLSTGNISKVTAETIEKQPVANVLGAISGRMPGVYIQQQSGVPGGGFDIQIRGINSIASGNQPLYLIDGVPFPSVSIASPAASGGILPNASPLSLINPLDIESVEILKDADATAIYGSRGANGVVLIKTKKGTQGSPKLVVNYQQGAGRITRKIQMLSTAEYVQMRSEAFANDKAQPGPRDYDVNGTWDKSRYTDWQKELIGGTAKTINGQLSLSGGSQNVSYLVSGNFYRETTVFPGDLSYQRGTGYMNLNVGGPTQNFHGDFSVSYSRERNNLAKLDLTSLITIAPNAPALFDESGQLNWANGTFSNPLAYLRRKYNAQASNLIANGALRYRLARGLEVKANLGYTTMSRGDVQTNPLSSYSPFSNTTPASISSYFANSQINTWMAEPQLSWETKTDLGQFSVLAGGTLQQTDSKNLAIQGTGFTSDDLTENIASANSLKISETGYGQYHYAAVYGRLNYNSGGKYLLNLTARRDGSSRFGPNRRLSNFGAVGMAWIFSQEPFFKNNLPILSLGKIRASYGVSGNDRIGDYGYLGLWQTTTNAYQGSLGLYPVRIPNPDFAWEKNKKLEFALETGFNGDRLNLSVAYYRNRSSSLLVGRPLPPSTGFNSVQDNLPAKVQNTGWEVQLQSVNLRNKNLKWQTFFNLTVPSNKLISFPGLESNFSFADRYEVGKALSVYKALPVTGVDPLTGQFAFEDTDGDGTAMEYPDDLKANKKIDRSYFGSLENTFRFGAWEAGLTIQFVKQTGTNYIKNSAPAGSFNANQPKSVLARWQKEGDVTSVPRFMSDNYISLEYLYAMVYGDVTVSDASFIRLKNVYISFQTGIPSKSKTGKQLRIFLQGQNLATFSDFAGLDPESQSYLTLPPLAGLCAGVNFSF